MAEPRPYYAYIDGAALNLSNSTHHRTSPLFPATAAGSIEVLEASYLSTPQAHIVCQRG
jgi:hypothetical protein